MGSFEPVSEQGILLRLVHDLFEEVKKLRADGYFDFAYELVNYRINGLLNPRTYLGYTGCWIRQVTAPTLAVTY